MSGSYALVLSSNPMMLRLICPLFGIRSGDFFHQLSQASISESCGLMCGGTYKLCLISRLYQILCLAKFGTFQISKFSSFAKFRNEPDFENFMIGRNLEIVPDIESFLIGDVSKLSKPPSAGTSIGTPEQTHITVVHWIFSKPAHCGLVAVVTQ